jgi:hypothetical protein
MTTVEARSELPDPLKVWWFVSFPIAALLAARIMWDAAVWTRSRGPQMVGFSLMHVHPYLCDCRDGVLPCSDGLAFASYSIHHGAPEDY